MRKSVHIHNEIPFTRPFLARRRARAGHARLRLVLNGETSEEAVVMDKEDNEDLFHKQIGVRIAVWITCSLSMLGALLIIFSYVFFKSMRSRAREILVHISIMDFLVAASNLTAAAVDFDRFYH